MIRTLAPAEAGAYIAWSQLSHWERSNDRVRPSPAELSAGCKIAVLDAGDPIFTVVVERDAEPVLPVDEPGGGDPEQRPRLDSDDVQLAVPLGKLDGRVVNRS